MLSLSDSVIFGLVEGITEFLPISSTGHLILAQHFLQIPTSPALSAYLVAIQLGAILAVVALYGHRFVQLFAGIGDLFRPASTPAKSLLINLLIAFFPAALIGLVADNFIESHLFNPTTVALSMAAGAFLMLIASRWPHHTGSVDGMTTKNSLIIGLWQVLALIPGTSRSMTTLVGGFTQKLSAVAAAEFSFLLGAVTLGAASLYKLVRHGQDILSLGLTPVIVGFVVAFISALIVVKLFVGILTRFGLAPWAWYRIAAAGAILFVLVGR